MFRVARKLLVLGSVAVVGAGGLAAAASAQNQMTPKNFNYIIKDGKPVPKGNRVVNADGSWREEIRQGKCVTIKEKSASGEYRETRQCNPD